MLIKFPQSIRRWRLALLAKRLTLLENFNIPSAERTEWLAADSNDNKWLAADSGEASFHELTDEEIVAYAREGNNDSCDK